jgi:hypothetical protein
MQTDVCCVTKGVRIVEVEARRGLGAERGGARRYQRYQRPERGRPGRAAWRGRGVAPSEEWGEGIR